MNIIIKKIKTLIKNPYKVLAKLIKGKMHFLNDKIYLSIMYRANFDKKLDWDNPVTYNEKLQWLKIYDRNPMYNILADKSLVKDYVAKKIGDKYVIPTLGVWDTFDEIEFDKLPKKFVLKCTHDSGGVVVVSDKGKMDYMEVRKKIETNLKKNYYWRSREWLYKDVKPRIIAEQYMEEKEINYTGGLRDYKFFCFSGKPELLFVASDRNVEGSDVKFDYYDMNFNKLPMRQAQHSVSNYKIPKPASFDEMIKIATKLSENFLQVRIDLYEINGKVYFGEYTFFHHGGLVPFIPEEWDKKLGDLINLEKVKKNEK